MVDKLRQEYLISYDITDNRSRSKLYNELSKYGLKSVQNSVFWGFLTSGEFEAVKRLLHVIVAADTDKVFVGRTNFHGNSLRYTFGHADSDFDDWAETYVI